MCSWYINSPLNVSRAYIQKTLFCQFKFMLATTPCFSCCIHTKDMPRSPRALLPIEYKTTSHTACGCHLCRPLTFSSVARSCEVVVVFLSAFFPPLVYYCHHSGRVLSIVSIVCHVSCVHTARGHTHFPTRVICCNVLAIYHLWARALTDAHTHTPFIYCT